MLRSTQLPAVASPGRACENCARAKAKCEPQHGEPTNICARCFRLKKECNVLPRRARKKRSPNVHNNITQLEQKIEGLVTLITSKQGPSNQALPPAQGQTPDEVLAKAQAIGEAPRYPSLPVDWSRGHSSQACGPPTWDSHMEDGSISNTTLPTQPFLREKPPGGFSNDIQATPHHLPQDYDDVYRFTVFKERFAPHFPFVVIPPLITCEELQNKRPWLYRVIILIASQYQRVCQIDKAKRFLLDISAAMLLRGERSLDMLEGLILYNAWSYAYTPMQPSAQSTAIFQLTLAMLFDLGLAKSTHEHDDPAEVMEEEHLRNNSSEPKNQVKRTLEERRTLLSCFVISSVHVLCVKKIEGLQITPYLESCCQAIEEAHENESDIILVSLVRLHCIIQSIMRFVPTKTNNITFTAPIAMLVKQARSNLEAFWNSLSLSMQQHPLVRICYHGAEISLYEHSLIQTAWPPSFSGSSETQRLDMLFSCLSACKSTLDIALSAPASAYSTLSIMDLGHIGHGFSTLIKIILADEPGWDMLQIRQAANFNYYFNNITAKFEEAGDEIDAKQAIPYGHSFPKGCAIAMRKVKARYERKLAVSMEQTTETVQEPTNVMGIEEGLNGDDLQGLDDDYWLEFVGGLDLMQWNMDENLPPIGDKL